MAELGWKGWLTALSLSVTWGACAPVKAASVLPSGVSAVVPASVPERAHAHHHHHDEAGVSPQALAERQRLIDTGEASLQVGDVEAARRAFEQAANMAHMGEIELGLLRTQMQAGEYRQALAFAAHTAGVHLDDVEGAAFYAWLLNLGGQVAIADQALQAAESREPEHAMLKAVRQRLQSGAMLASADLLKAPARLAPFATGAVPVAAAQVAATGLLLADGRHALVPRSALHAGASIWLRNGLGQTVQAKLEHPGELDQDKEKDHDHDQGPGEHDDPNEHLGLVMLHLAAPLPVPAVQTVPPRDAFAGSPAFALDFLPDAAAQPAWPVMRAGFVGAPLSLTSPWSRLGVGLPLSGASLRGGPVYDAGGRLLGLALAGDAGVDRLVPITALRKRFGDRFGAATTEPRPSPVGADEVYERALKVCLQVLVARP
jgi:hypothetical protein